MLPSPNIALFFLLGQASCRQLSDKAAGDKSNGMKWVGVNGPMSVPNFTTWRWGPPPPVSTASAVRILDEIAVNTARRTQRKTRRIESSSACQSADSCEKSPDQQTSCSLSLHEIPDVPAKSQLHAWLSQHKNYTGVPMTVRSVFDSIDVDGTGYLQLHEIFDRLGAHVSMSDVKSQFAELDEDGDGQLFFLNSTSHETVQDTVTIHHVLDRLAVSDSYHHSVHDLILDKLALDQNFSIRMFLFRQFESPHQPVFALGVMAIVLVFCFQYSCAQFPRASESQSQAAYVGPRRVKKVPPSPARSSPRRRKGQPSLHTTTVVSRGAAERSPTDKGADLLSLLSGGTDTNYPAASDIDPAVVASVSTLPGNEWQSVTPRRGRRARQKSKQPQHSDNTASQKRGSNQVTNACVPQISSLDLVAADASIDSSSQLRKALLSPTSFDSRNNTDTGDSGPGAAWARLPRTASGSVLHDVTDENTRSTDESTNLQSGHVCDFQWQQQLYSQQCVQNQQQLVQQSQPQVEAHTSSQTDIDDDECDLVTVETVVFMNRYYLVDANTLEVYNFNDGVNEVINPQPIGFWSPETHTVHFSVPSTVMWQNTVSQSAATDCFTQVPPVSTNIDKPSSPLQNSAAFMAEGVITEASLAVESQDERNIDRKQQ